MSSMQNLIEGTFFSAIVAQVLTEVSEPVFTGPHAACHALCLISFCTMTQDGY